jgi:hypothetical protein
MKIQFPVRNLTQSHHEPGVPNPRRIVAQQAKNVAEMKKTETKKNEILFHFESVLYYYN